MKQTAPLPWYAPKQTAKPTPASTGKGSRDGAHCLKHLLPLVCAALCLVGASFCLGASLFFPQKWLFHALYDCASFVLFVLSIILVLHVIGRICFYFSTKVNSTSSVSTAVRYLQGLIPPEDARHAVPAPEMALYQFIQQVRAYAVEKSFLRQKQEKGDQKLNAHGQQVDAILKRRWNDVIDSLNEFEIYLANDPAGMIETLIAKSPIRDIDVSQIFRDVAETFDTTWRRKGINIEQAIVTPLRANTNEALLRRLLVGPWRTCVYFARRGNEVIFTANSKNGKVVAHWECEGIVYPEEFFRLIRESELSVNERIEQGMSIIGGDPNSPNALFALISFVTWLDLAKASGIDYSIKQGSEGLIIELRV